MGKPLKLVKQSTSRLPRLEYLFAGKRAHRTLPAVRKAGGAPASAARSSARAWDPPQALRPSRGAAVDDRGPAVLMNTGGPQGPEGSDTTRSQSTASAAVEETALGLDGGGAAARAEPPEEP